MCFLDVIGLSSGWRLPYFLSGWMVSSWFEMVYWPGVHSALKIEHVAFSSSSSSLLMAPESIISYMDLESNMLPSHNHHHC